RMEQEDTGRIDESLGLEICKREGIKAMLVPKISHVGDTYSLSASIVDVNRGTRLSPIRITVSGRDEVLISAVDDISRRIRKDLGESMQSIEKSDKNLAKVTTSSLAALEQYSIGREIHRSPQSWEEVMVFYNNAIEIDSTFSAAYAASGTVCNNLGMTEKAKNYYLKAYEYSDNLTEREKYRIVAEYYSIVEEDPGKALKTYRAFLEMYPDDVDARNNLGLTYRMLGRDDEAAAEFWKTLEIDPYHMLTYNNLVILYTDIEQYDRAIETADSCSTIDPDYSAVYNFKGIAYVKMARHEEALDSFRKCLSLDPDNYWAFYLLGDTYITLGRYDEAVTELNRAVRLDPDNYYALITMARLYSLRGETEESIQYLVRAVDRGYGDYDYVNGSSDLENARKDPRIGTILNRLKGGTDNIE
ncbi:MAG: tetratricopeptide repeat protein, partial [Candidatus Krumholzibacteria bacterium]|nr:tetratricopeptide repeat protein [Candidatus Krumholzibacteria bacterium]